MITKKNFYLIKDSQLDDVEDINNAGMILVHMLILSMAEDTAFRTIAKYHLQDIYITSQDRVPDNQYGVGDHFNGHAIDIVCSPLWFNIYLYAYFRDNFIYGLFLSFHNHHIHFTNFKNHSHGYEIIKRSGSKLYPSINNKWKKINFNLVTDKIVIEKFHPTAILDAPKFESLLVFYGWKKCPIKADVLQEIMFTVKGYKEITGAVIKWARPIFKKIKAKASSFLDILKYGSIIYVAFKIFPGISETSTKRPESKKG